LAAEIPDFDPRSLLDDRKVLKLIRRSDVLGLAAAAQAIGMAELETRRGRLSVTAAEDFDDGTGVFVGSGGSSYQDQYDFFPLMTRAEGGLPAFGRELERAVHPMWLLRSLPNNVLCHLGIHYGFKGPNSCITHHSVSGLLALSEAANTLRHGEAKRAVAVGHEAPIEPQRVQYFGQLGLLTADAVRPFDAARSGCVLGEGAAALVLEERSEARAHGARLLGEILGSACVTEGEGLFHVRPDGDGLARAIELALADAGVDSGDVGMIVAHGNGTRNSDASEAAAIRRVFAATLPPITAFKWSFGHSLAAAGIVDAALALLALRDAVVPGIATLRRLDADCGEMPISSDAQRPRSNVALVLSRGFAGMNVALLLRGPGPP
jgi:3-oxoacyl-[acyl-carrier-protein] synthase-1